jgi:hypothetical protein
MIEVRAMAAQLGGADRFDERPQGAVAPQDR